MAEKVTDYVDITLDTDELGIWLIDDTEEGPKQMGFISWKKIAREVQIALAEMDEDD